MKLVLVISIPFMLATTVATPIEYVQPNAKSISDVLQDSTSLDTMVLVAYQTVFHMPSNATIGFNRCVERVLYLNVGVGTKNYDVNLKRGHGFNLYSPDSTQVYTVTYHHTMKGKESQSRTFLLTSQKTIKLK